ncbi:phage tail protein [Neisseria sp. RH3002v2f]|uniref:phage tail protein n=1 Tax=Neisseria sp. RH3002v2f TaxID=1871108 RepID=UPI00166133E8|nr:phage tail protein [Neisseria sp. RH3002v2f]MBD0765088.1 phage tail protein [Neisseria sp. RH3002v2f]
MGGKSSTITSAEERILSLQVQQSSQGLTLPVIYGRTRVAGNLIWYGDFVTIEHKTTTRQGGKGGGGITQEDIKYTYEAAVMLALCEGEIQGVGRIWREKEKFDSLAQLRLTLMRGGDEQPLWTHLQQAKHQDQALNYSGTAYLCSPNYELTKSAQIYQHNFEVIGKLGYSGNIPDANPREIVLDLLTNQRYGCGFPSQNIGDTDRYSNYCRAVGIFLSPAYTEQGEAQRNISELLEQTNSAAVFSQGRLKIIPYGDGSYSGNGAVYVADNKAIYDLTDDDFIVSGAQDPVKVERKTNADAFNQIQVEYLDRNNDYNVAIAEVKDQANIEQYGLRPKDAIKMHGICDAKVAQKVAQQLLQRALYVRNEYEFKLGWKYCLLEPMDIVTLTDAGLGLNKTPVRITEIEEDEEGVLSVKAEDYPVGVYTVSEYPTQPSLGYSADYNVSPGNAHVPVIFEAPLQLTGGEPQIWLATAGGDMWGGAEVWVSTDGDSYTRVGAVNHKARFGSLTAALPNGAVFDRTNTLGVEISAGQLTGGTEQDSRDLLTLCYVDGEFLAYANAELKGVGRYTLGNLTRGAYGSAINAHATGSQFARIDEALFKYAVPRNWIGRTVWVKLVSYNVFSGGIQDLAEVPAYSYTIKGAPLGQIQNLRLTSSWAYGKEAVIAWDKLDGADTYDVEIYAGNSQRRLREVSGIVDNSYTYTQADMKSDGGQVRDIVFKVRGRAVTGKTGNWAQIAAQNPQIQALQGIAIDSGLKQAFFTCQKPAEEDFAGIIVWVSENAAVPTTDANKVYDGAETFVTIAKCNGKPLEKDKTYHLRAAGYDSFGKDNLRVSSSVSFTVYDVSTNDLSESNLNQALRDKINLIDGNGTGSVNERIKNAKEDSKREVQTLSSRLDAFEVGGRNYALSTGNEAKVLRVSGNNQTKNVTIDVSSALELKQGDSLIISCDIELTNATSPYGKPYPRIGAEFSVTYADNSIGYFDCWYGEAVSGTTKTLKQRLVARHTVAKEVKALRSIIVQARYQTSESIKVLNVKLERGTVATDWTPAPEDNDGLQEVRGKVQVVQHTLTQATGDIKSLGERITAAESTADGNKATVQTHARSINGLEAQYTVKVDVNGRVAGFGLATTPKNGTPESKFIVNADRFGIGATGKADVFPFVVDTQKNRVGVNGELVVNGKAIVDKLNAGDIHGDKITANTLDANRLKAGSVTAREIGANSVTADKMNVTSLSAVSSNLGSITGGSLSIGDGKFSVTENGVLTANDAVIRGRIEADSGYFNGMIKASRIEGDVMKVHRMRQVSENVWELTLPPDDLVRMIKVEILLNAEPAPAILEWSENARRHVYVPNSANPRTLRLTINNDVIEIKAEGIVTQPINKTTSSISTILVETVWITIPTGAVNIRLEHQKEGNRDNAYKVIKLLGGVTTSYLSPSDPEYKDLSGTKIWRVFKDSLTLRVHPNYKNRIGLPGTNRPILYAASLSLPNNIYGLSFEYRVDTNTSWATGIYWNYHPEARTIKEYSSRNHNGEFKLFTQELSTVSTMSSIDLIGEQDWQWVELRNIRVLIPESRKDEVW